MVKLTLFYLAFSWISIQLNLSRRNYRRLSLHQHTSCHDGACLLFCDKSMAAAVQHSIKSKHHHHGDLYFKIHLPLRCFSLFIDAQSHRGLPRPVILHRLLFPPDKDRETLLERHMTSICQLSNQTGLSLN